MESKSKHSFHNLSSSYYFIIDTLKTNLSEASHVSLYYQTSYGESIKIVDESTFGKAINEVSNVKTNGKSVVKFYWLAEKEKSNCNKENNETKISSGESCLISNKLESVKDEKDYTSSYPKNRLKKLSRLKLKSKKKIVKKVDGPFKITRNHSIPKRAARRDILKGKEKYLIVNLDRFKKHIPRLVNSHELSDKLTEWFLLSKTILKTTLNAIKHPLIKRLNAFADFIPEHSFRIRFQFFTRDRQNKVRKYNKSFSFYESGVEKSWSLEEGRQRMSNFLDFATRNIEIINGPISLRDF
jgi:hypothetical protein